MALPSFQQIMVAQRRAQLILPNRILCVDPGANTGLALIAGGRPIKVWQERLIDASNIGIAVSNVIRSTSPDHIVIEDYRVYSSHAAQHVNSDLYVAKLIGRFQQVGDMIDIPYSMKMAAESKAFVTDDKLKAWGFIKDDKHEERHGRDALRLGYHYLLFG